MRARQAEGTAVTEQFGACLVSAFLGYVQGRQAVGIMEVDVTAAGDQGTHALVVSVTRGCPETRSTFHC